MSSVLTSSSVSTLVKKLSCCLCLLVVFLTALSLIHLQPSTSYTSTKSLPPSQQRQDDWTSLVSASNLSSSPNLLDSPTADTVRVDAGGYVMTLGFSEQLESGMYDLQQLTDLANSWQFRVVEPYIQNSKFSFPSLPYAGHLLKFSEVYDLQDFNANMKLSLNTSSDPLVTLSGAAKDLKSAGFHVVVLRLLHYTVSLTSCANTDIKHFLEKLTSHFKCSAACRMNTSVVCLNVGERNNFRKLLKGNQIMKQIRKQTLEAGSKMVVLVPLWNGIRTYRHHFYYWDPFFKLNYHPYRYRYSHATKHSARVQSAAQDFQRTLQLTPPTLGIHVRLERLLRVKPFVKAVLMKCLSRMEVLITSFQDKLKINSSVLFRDYGAYGSSTCQQVECNKFAMDIQLDQRLRRLGVKVQEFRPKSRELRKQHGFSANVEQEILAQSDFLITVGYGSFQRGVVDRFTRNKEGGGAMGREQKVWQEQDRIFKICDK